MSSYEFTAFQESALLTGNDTSLGHGDTFVMPQSASVTFVVSDNDTYLSGDSKKNENADDKSGQTAEITTAAGDDLGNGRQIYAETYHWVHDQNGNWYVMIEIEQEGTGDTYFTFYEGSGYTTPPAGTSLTVTSQCNVTSDWIKYNDLDAGDLTPPNGWINGRFTIDGDANDNEWNDATGQWDDGIEGAVIQLLDLQGNVVAEAVTDAYGWYHFDVPAGDYRIQFPPQDGYEFSAQDSGVAEHYDSDADASGLTDVITVVAGQTVHDLGDAGVKLVPVPAPITVDAADDILVVTENEGAGDFDINILANDTSDLGPVTKVFTVEGQTAKVGQWINLEAGGRVRIDQDGNLDFDADGDFTALNDGESAIVNLEYSIAEIQTEAEETQHLSFNEFARGTVITNQFAAAGLTISSANSNNPVMIFDTAHATGGDTDLATNNLGKVLILSEDRDSNDPDDNAGGGTFIFEYDRPADVTSLTFLDTEEPGAQIKFYDDAGSLITTIQGPVTANGGQATVNFDVSGVARMEIKLQGSGAIDNLSYTFPATETILAEDTATVTIEVQGIDDVANNIAPIAVNDAFVTDEASSITGNVLSNDSDPDGDAISVVGVEGGQVGQSFEVTTAKGYTGQVTLNADGSFSFAPDASFKSLAANEQDSFDLTYTISDDPTTAQKTNLLFVLDVSNSTVGESGDNVFVGTGVGDVNGDGRADTVLDAEIAAVINAVNKLLAQGIDPNMVDVGIVTFSGLVDLTRFAAPFNNPTEDATTVGTWQLDEAALIAALTDINSGGWTNYEAGLQEAEAWLAEHADAGEANNVYFLSDGRPIIDSQNGVYVTQTSADYGDEVARIANNYDASIYAIGVGANSDLTYLNEIDNTGGAEQVLDSAALTVLLEDLVVLPQTDTATITVTINGLNEGPDAVDDEAITDEDSAISGNLLTNDTDPNGDSLTVTALSFGAVGVAATVASAAGVEGELVVNADGSYSFTPGAGFDALAVGESDTVTFTYTVSDGNGGVDTASVTITVNGLNEGPDAVDDDAITDEDSAISGNLLTNDTDPNGDSLTVTALSFGAVGVAATVASAAGVEGELVVNADGSYSFTPGAGFDALAVGESDTVTFTYTVSDGNGGVDTASVTITVNGLNEAPVAVDEVFTIDENDRIGVASGDDNDSGTVYELNVFDNDNDADGDILTITSVFGADPATAVAAGTPITVTTANGIEVSVTIAPDGRVLFDTGDKFKSLPVGESDSLVVNYTIDDGNGGTDSAEVTIIIDGLNEVPVASNDVKIISETGKIGVGSDAVTLNVLDNDEDADGDVLSVVDANGVPAGQPFTVTTANGVAVQVVVGSDGTVSFDTAGQFSDLNDGETDTLGFTYTVSDGNGGTDSADVSITIEGEGSVSGPQSSLNIVFVVDASSSNIAANSAAAFFEGFAGNKDIDGDDNPASQLDSMLYSIQQISDTYAAAGQTDVDISIVLDGRTTAILGDPSDGDTVFTVGQDLSAAFNTIQEVPYFAAGEVDTSISLAGSILSDLSANDQAGLTENRLFLMTSDTLSFSNSGIFGLLNAVGGLGGVLGQAPDTDSLVFDSTFGSAALLNNLVEAVAGDGSADQIATIADLEGFLATINDDLIV